MAGLENNWRLKNLTDLEKDEWIHFGADSRLIKRTKELRKIPLSSFTTEDLRLMIGQQIGLEYLVPLTLETLKDNLFAEGDYFEGDLLKNTLEIRPEFWKENKTYWLALHELINERRDEIADLEIDTTKFDNYRNGK